MTTIKEIIQNNFSNAALRYDSNAVVQQLSGEDLLKTLPKDFTPKTVLDLGCGTGLLSELLVKKFPSAQLTGLDIAPGMISLYKKKFESNDLISTVSVDSEFYNFPEKYDLIISNYCLQWFQNKKKSLEQIISNTKNIFTAAVPVTGSYNEIYNCLNKINRSSLTLDLLTANEWKSIFAANNLETIHFSVIENIQYFETPELALRSLHNIGASKSSIAKKVGLTLSEMRTVIGLLKAAYKPGEYPVSYYTFFYTGIYRGTKDEC